MQVASEGIESPKHSVPVDAALAVLEGLEAQSEVSAQTSLQGDGDMPSQLCLRISMLS